MVAHGEEDGRPEVMLASPYLRAVETAQLFRDAGGCPPDECICLDERLRENGVRDPRRANPDRDQRAPARAGPVPKLLGKFYHRPPGGESWVDVIFRLRALMDNRLAPLRRAAVMIVAHQVVVLCCGYVIEKPDRGQILSIDKAGDVANCAINRVQVRCRGRAKRQPRARALQRHRADGAGRNARDRRPRRDGRGARMSS